MTAFAAMIALCGASTPAWAQLTAEDVPPELQGVGVVERLDQTLPLHLTFRNEQGSEVSLRELLQSGRPVILTPVYYNCPMLCNLTLNGLVDGLKRVDWSAGNEFNIITFSFNPDEGPSLAEVKKRAYVMQYGRESARNGWTFLTGDARTIKELCDAIGFGYRYDAKSGEYAHTSTIVFITPDGRMARYMNEVMFEPRDLKFALIEASEGRIGSPMEKFLLFMCFQYDPESNSYAASAVKIMRLGGLLTLVVLAAGLGVLWWRGSSTKPVPCESSRE